MFPRARRVNPVTFGEAIVRIRTRNVWNPLAGGKAALLTGALDRYSNLVVPEKLGGLEKRDASLAEVRAYFDGLVRDLLSVVADRTDRTRLEE